MCSFLFRNWNHLRIFPFCRATRRSELIPIALAPGSFRPYGSEGSQGFAILENMVNLSVRANLSLAFLIPRGGCRNARSFHAMRFLHRG
jgi:hypothetical protein